MTPAQRSFWVNGTLLVLAMVASVALLLTSKSVTSEEREIRARHLLTAFRLDDVSQLSVQKATTNPGDPGIEKWVVSRAERGPDGDGVRWRLVAPLQGDAEEASIDQLLRTLQFATWLRRIDEADVERRRFGLDEPRVVIEVLMGELRYRLRLGGDAPSPPGARYVEVSGEGAPDKGVFVIGESTARDLDPDLEDFRIRQIIPYAGSALRSIEFTRGEHRVVLQRDSAGVFRLGGPEGTRVGREALDRMLLSFSRTVAKSFLSIEQAKSVQAERADVVHLELSPKEPAQPTAKLSIGGACPSDSTQVVALRSAPKPAAACIDDGRLAELFARPELLADTELFTLRADEVESVEIAQGDRRMRLLRAEDGWVLREPVDGKVENEVGLARVREMVSVRGELVAQPNLDELGFGAATHRVTLGKATSKPEGESEVIELTSTNGRIYARRAADGAVLAINPASHRLFTADSLLLLDLQLLDLEPSKVAAVSVEHDGQTWVLKQPRGGEFELVSPPALTVDSALASAWIAATAQLSAERWVAEADDGSFGLGDPLLAVKVTDVQQHSTQLIVGGRAPGGYFATVADRPQVMVVDSDVVATLTTLIVDRSGFTLDPDLAVDIVVRRADQVLRLERLGSGFVQSGGTLQLAPTQITELVDALALVRPEAAVALTSDGSRHDFRTPVLEVKFRHGDPAGSKEQHYVVGAADGYRGLSVHAARRSDGGPVYVIPRQQIARVLELL